jgi:hypothetical protein
LIPIFSKILTKPCPVIKVSHGSGADGNGLAILLPKKEKNPSIGNHTGRVPKTAIFETP